MGKIHDALEKSGRTKGLKVAPAVRSKRLANDQAGGNQIKVIKPTTECQDGTDVAIQRIDPHLVTYHEPVQCPSRNF